MSIALQLTILPNYLDKYAIRPPKNQANLWNPAKAEEALKGMGRRPEFALPGRICPFIAHFHGWDLHLKRAVL